MKKAHPTGFGIGKEEFSNLVLVLHEVAIQVYIPAEFYASIFSMAPGLVI
jgi:hypothetical protein